MNLQCIITVISNVQRDALTNKQMPPTNWITPYSTSGMEECLTPSQSNTCEGPGEAALAGRANATRLPKGLAVKF